MFVTTLSGDEGRLPFCSAGVWWPFIAEELSLRRERIDDCSSAHLFAAFASMARPLLLCCLLSSEVVIQAYIEVSEEGSPP